jgi:thiamine-monophosphate kinase
MFFLRNAKKSGMGKNMRLKDIGEFGLIERITRGCVIRTDGVVRAIGDDAAAFSLRKGEICLVTTDLLVEGIHFHRDATSAENLGYKSLAVNLSDIAAMGGRAREAFVSIAVPEDLPVEFLENLYSGMKKLAAKYDVNILGGDTTGSRKDLVVNVAVVGSVPPEEILCRNTARPGDRIFVTGDLGDSRAGCHLLLNQIPADTGDLQKLLDAHILPEPHLKEGRHLAMARGVHAAIDISDGLSSDLGHILSASGVGARIAAEKIPISGALRKFCRDYNEDPVPYALSGGEDYVLICTVDGRHANSVISEFETCFGRPLYEIGKITETSGMEIRYPDGDRKTLEPRGWNHFIA